LADVVANAKARQDLVEAELANYRDEAYSLRDKVNTYAAQANSMKEALSEMNAKLARAEEMGEETGAEADLLREQIESYEDALAEMEEKTTTQQDLIESKVEVYRDEARLLRTQISGYADQMSSMEKEVKRLNAKLAEAEGNKAHDTSLRNKIQHYESRASAMRHNISKLSSKLSRAEEKAERERAERKRVEQERAAQGKAHREKITRERAARERAERKRGKEIVVVGPNLPYYWSYP
jgi:chromosome segregation ATPase